MKNQIIHTLVISAAILGAGFVIGKIVKDKPQAVTEAKPASKQTEPAQVVKADANDELIKELVVVNSELKKEIAEQNKKIKLHTVNSDIVQRVYRQRAILETENNKLKKRAKLMGNWFQPISMMDLGYGTLDGTLDPKRFKQFPEKKQEELKYIRDRIKDLQGKQRGFDSASRPTHQVTGPIHEMPRTQNPVFHYLRRAKTVELKRKISENQMLITALEFRLDLLELNLYVDRDTKEIKAIPVSSSRRRATIDPATGLPIGFQNSFPSRPVLPNVAQPNVPMPHVETGIPIGGIGIPQGGFPSPSNTLNAPDAKGLPKK